MLRCRSLPRLEELALAIREGDLDFAAAAIDFQRAQKVLRADGLAHLPRCRPSRAQVAAGSGQ